jgi:hypothetical protein
MTSFNTLGRIDSFCLVLSGIFTVAGTDSARLPRLAFPKAAPNSVPSYIKYLLAFL